MRSDDKSGFVAGGETDILAEKASKIENFAFFMIYPLFDQSRTTQKKWTIFSWIILSLETISIAVYGIDFNGVGIVNKACK